MVAFIWSCTIYRTNSEKGVVKLFITPLALDKGIPHSKTSPREADRTQFRSVALRVSSTVFAPPEYGLLNPEQRLHIYRANV